MNGLIEIQGFIEEFINEKKEVQRQIVAIEEKRTQLAEQRNEKKSTNGDWAEINELGIKISELGNQSQGLQNKLDFKYNGIKTRINLSIDNLITEGIRKIRKINEEVQELEKINSSIQERNERYQLQKPHRVRAVCNAGRRSWQRYSCLPRTSSGYFRGRYRQGSCIFTRI